MTIFSKSRPSGGGRGGLTLFPSQVMYFLLSLEDEVSFYSNQTDGPHKETILNFKWKFPDLTPSGGRTKYEDFCSMDHFGQF